MLVQPVKDDHDDGGLSARLRLSAQRRAAATPADRNSTAAAEIVADFPDLALRETVIIEMGPLPREDVIASGLVYRRAE